MSAASQTTGVRPPPPRYTEALNYPVTGDVSIHKKTWQVCNGRPLDTCVYFAEPIYQTLPFDTVSLYDLPGHYYKNVPKQSKITVNEPKYRHSFSGKTAAILEAIPENKADHSKMGVKTYAQLEVVAAGSQREDELLGGCVGTVENGRAVLVPLKPGVEDDPFPPPPDPSELSADLGSPIEVDYKDPNEPLDPFADPACERLLPESLIEDADETECDSPTEGQPNADSGFSECSRFDFTDMMVAEPVLYSEPEYSSSDVSIKGGCDNVAPHGAVKCQRTLKRTYNGVNHTVYELSPSDSFYNSVGDNPGEATKRSSAHSSDGISRLAHSTGSPAETTKSRTSSGRRGSRTLSLDKCSQSLLKGKCSEDTSTTALTVTDDPLSEGASTRTAVQTLPGEVTNTVSVLDDVRRDYKRKAADRGTLYCACGGISIVATIVFLLIYFS